MNFDQIIDWYNFHPKISLSDQNRVLSHPQNYPGKHLESEPKAQFHIIIRALKTYIREKLENGKVI
jgi:hypothetical protein